MKVIVEKDDETLVVKGAKLAYDAVKNKLVSIITGNQALSSIGTILNLLSFMPGVDKDAVENKMKQLSQHLNSNIEDFDEFMKSIPMLELIFGDEKECLKNIMRFEVFVQQISLGQYPAENYDLKNVALVQTTLSLLIGIWVAFGAGVVGTGGIALCVSWIVKDLSVLCYNKVFPVVEGDLKKFEKWAKSNNMDVEKSAKDISDGKKGEKLAAESLFGAIAKAGAKLVGKGAAKAGANAATKGATKAATKGATTLAGKAASKLAPAATKGLRKVGSKVLQGIAKLSPKTASVLKKGATGLAQVLKKSGITMDYALGKVGDYIANAYEKASNEDKKVLDVIKEDLAEATNTDNLKEKLEVVFDAIAQGEASQEEQANESTKWIPLRGKSRWISLESV